MKHLHHIHIFILIGAILLATMLILINQEAEKLSLSNKTTFGVSFTPSYAKDLGLNPKDIYSAMLNELKVKHLRLSAHWDDIEPFDSAQGKPFYFEDLDWYINQAEQNEAEVILAIGYKLPRWPECREPKWLEYNNYNDYKNYNLLRERQLTMLSEVINHYDDNPAVVAFQLENEPLLQFGQCPSPDREFLEKEVNFVKSKTEKPIIITDSGELRPWITPMKYSDIFGTTLYRVVETPWLGPFQYPFRPWVYRVKSDLVRKFFAKDNQKTIISELQAEPWSMEPLTKALIETQVDRFSLERFQASVDFARRTGFPEAYLWGTEWWYFMSKNGHPEYLNFAKSLF